MQLERNFAATVKERYVAVEYLDHNCAIDQREKTEQRVRYGVVVMLLGREAQVTRRGGFGKEVSEKEALKGVGERCAELGLALLIGTELAALNER